MEIDPTRICELLVGLPDIDVIGVDDPEPGRLVVVVEPREHRPVCERCGTSAWVKDRREVDLVDLAAFDQWVVLRVVRTRWCCPRFLCGVGSWTLEHPEIALAGHRVTIPRLANRLRVALSSSRTAQIVYLENGKTYVKK